MTARIRIEGTEEECNHIAKELEKIATVRTVSTFYPNRRSVEGRVYVKVELNE